MSLMLTLLLSAIFMAQIYLAIKAYVKINFGKQKSEVKEINSYIYFSIGYTAVMMMVITIIFHKH